MKQKKLIIFFPSIENGGVEKNLYIISNFLSKKIKDTSIITSNPEKIKIQNRKIKIVTNKIDSSKKSRFLKNLVCIFLLISEIKKSRNIVVLSFQSSLYATIVCYLFGVKIISRANASPSGWSKNPVKKILYKYIIKLTSAVVVNSKGMMVEFKNKFNINCNLIYNPLDKKNIIKKSQKKVSLNFFNNNNLKIINIGRLTKQKDQITLLKALNLVKRKLNFNLIILGSGSEKNRLEKYLSENNLNKLVKILKHTNNPYPLLKKSDVFVLSSRFEGLPNVLLESIVLKKLIISSDCPTGPREILLNGKAGILFKTGDYFDLYKKILSLKKNQKINKKKIIIAEKTLNKYDLKLNLNRYYELYKKFCYLR